MKRALLAILAICLVLPVLAGCDTSADKPDDTTTTPPAATTPVVTTPADTTPADTTPVDTTTPETTPAETTPADTTPAVTTPSDTTTAAPSEKTELAVTWHLGYVGSDTHTSSAYAINPTGGKYSYSDVIVIEKAGTEISFTDDNQNSGGDTLFASTAAFVISSWKKEGNDWVIDKSGMNIAGSGSAQSAIAYPSGSTVTYKYVTSQDNECIRLCYRSGQTTTFVPGYPTVYMRTGVSPATAELLGSAADEYSEWIEQSKKTSYYKCLEGVKFSVIGDSYLAGDKLDTRHVWCSLLANKYGMKYSNNGKNGSTVSNYVTNKNPMVERWASVVAGSPDIIIIEGGRNDYNQKVPIGTNNDTDTKTFKGAVRYMIDQVRSKCPDALIICVTVWNVNSVNSIGNNCTDYGKAMIEVCELMNVPCFNAMDTAVVGVDMNDARFRAKYCQSSTDVSHLNQEGHRNVMPVFEKYIAEQYEAHLAGKK